MESDNLVWLLLGMLLAIGGALFMGCAAFISEQHAMISHVIVLEDPLHPQAGLGGGGGGMFPLHNGGSSAPAPTSQSDWQHNMAALEERVRAGDAGRYGLQCLQGCCCLYLKCSCSPSCWHKVVVFGWMYSAVEVDMVHMSAC